MRALALCWCFAALTAAAKLEPGSFTVSKTFDGKPFSYSMTLEQSQGDFDVYRLTYPSPERTGFANNDTVQAFYYLPKDVDGHGAPRPAVICAHILGGDQGLTKMVCAYMASRGVPAVMFWLPFYGDRRPPGTSRELEGLADPANALVMLFRQSILDSRRTIDLMLSRPEVDPSHLGMQGISMGGCITTSVAERDPRLDKVVLILAGGDYNGLIGLTRETRYMRDIIDKLPAGRKKEVEDAIRALDPLSAAELLRGKAKEGKLMMINATDDEIIPRRFAERLATAMDMRDKQIWLEGLGHYTALASMPDLLRRTSDFLGAASKSAPLRTKSATAGFFGSLAKMASLQPEPGRCFLVDCVVDQVEGPKTKRLGTLQFVRGEGARFALDATIPKFGKLRLGYDQAPWLLSEAGVLFKGGLGGSSSPVKFVSPKNLAAFRLVAGMSAMAAVSPDMLGQLVRISERRLPDGSTCLLFADKGGKTKAEVALQPDAATPAKASVPSRKGTIVVTVRHWQTDALATPETFAAPEAARTVEVDRQDLDRIFAATFNQLVERTR